MGYSIYKAFELLFTLDKEIYFIIFTSLNITFFSTIFASIMSIPLAFIIDISKPRFKKISIAILNSFMALPTVVIGLFVYAFISRSGPLGFMGLLFTPFGIIIGQTILAIPIIASMILAGFSKIDLRLYETLITLGAKKFDLLKAIIFETKTLILSAILGGFGRIIGEVGISMMLGGNIKWYTRTITTAIALETSKGEFYYALALGIILIIIAFGINLSAHLIIKSKDRWKIS
ncbi:MAG: Binding-protein-dependent transport system inner membrane component [Candidatus Curtissbacteria bacterium GW2011_GWD1_40_8]|nr:MAG: Binding-protein-dependent transport system inner membrane component [Candidatus Curtissbacteria bacterium GW2011_GWD1_40_8]OHD11172.1 MAG: hypothetical protein A2Z98_07965 [Spirochaetes bacterium GWB1_27_13]